MSYDIYIRRKDRLFIAEVPALPGCYTLGRSENEVLDNIRDVIDGYYRMLQKRRKHAPQVKVVRVWKDHRRVIRPS